MRSTKGIKNIPTVRFATDLSEAVQISAFLEEFSLKVSTEAHIHSVINASHEIFADRFDKHMKGVASTSKDEFFHVYEYSPTGNGYSWVGKPEHKLWAHTIRGTGSSRTFSWNWLPAKQYNPSYRQRRMSGPGFDGIRELSYKDFRKLMAKSASQGTGYRFVWKAPMLEFGIARVVFPKRKKLFIPRDGSFRFMDSITVEQMHPGYTRGNFTQEWIRFWSGDIGGQWEDVVGKQIVIDAKRRVEEAKAAGMSKPRKEMRNFGAATYGDASRARQRGKAMGSQAAKEHKKMVERLSKRQVGWK